MSYRRTAKQIRINKYTNYIIKKKGLDFLIELYLALVKYFRGQDVS